MTRAVINCLGARLEVSVKDNTEVQHINIILIKYYHSKLINTK